MYRAALLVAFIAIASLPGTLRAAETSPFAHLKFRGIGPAVSGGRVPAVAGTDADPFLYYIGGSGGGVWKTENGGITWDPVFAHKPVAAIGALAIAASNKNIVWVGTGEANPRNDDMTGDGVWASTNGGNGFTHRGLDGSAMISRILIDPKNPNVVLVAALGDAYADNEQRGVFRTTDGGKTWAKTLYVGPGSGASDMDFSPKNPRVVFAGIWQFRRDPWNLTSGGPDDGLYRSTDEGASWQKLTGRGLPAGLMGRIGVAVAPNNPRRVYALIQSKSGLLWRSDNGGDSWHFVTGNTIIDNRPFYFSHLYVDPTNENHLLAQSVVMAESKDAGKTWKEVRGAVHGDHHVLWWASDGRRIIDGNDGGVAHSIDGGKVWAWDNNIALGQFYHLGYDRRNPYTICGGLQDNQTFCGPSNSLDPMGILARDWYAVQGGDGVWVWPDPIDSNYIWSDYENGVLGIYDRRSQEIVDVSPYPRDTNGIPLAGLPYRFDWDSPIAFSPQDGHIAYFGGNVVFESTDRGRHWRVISPDLTLNDKLHQQVSGGPITLDVSGAEFTDAILDIAPSPVQAGVIWVGTDDGLVQLTKDGGAHWSNVTMKGIAPFGNVEAVEPSPFDAATAFAVVDRHLSGDRAPYIFETNDFGATWRSISANLPSTEFARTVRQDPHNADVLYAGLEDGLWISFDRGKSWQSFQLNLPTTSVHDLRIQPDANDLLVATHGRSLWILDDLTPLQQLEAARSAGEYLFPPRTAFRWFQQSPEQTQNGGAAQANYFSGDNPDYGALITFYQSSKSKNAPSADIVAAGGRVVRHIAGTHEVNGARKPYITNFAGINRFAWDLAEDGPAKWTAAPKWNRGPDTGVEAVPGTYTVRLHLGGRTLTRRVKVAPDPREGWTQAQVIQRHNFLAELYGELGRIDEALNHLDALRKQLGDREKAAGGNAALAKDVGAALDRGQGIESELSSNPQNFEDAFTFTAPDKLRERLQGVIGQIGGSFQPPFAPDEEQAAEVRGIFDRVMSAYSAFVNTDIAKLNAELSAAKLKPVR